jgi:glycerol transport system ATP-binding protein
VQVGTREELFERPAHTFVGHFIGSPGMNFLPAIVTGRAGSEAGAVPLGRAAAADDGRSRGHPPRVRDLAAHGRRRCRPRVTQVQDIGTYWLVTAPRRQRLKCAPAAARAGRAGRPATSVWLLLGEHTCYYHQRGAGCMSATPNRSTRRPGC